MRVALPLTLFVLACAGNWQAMAANQPPQVGILRPPYPGQGITAFVTIDDLMVIKVAARDPDGTVARVQLVANNELIAEWTNPPYSTVWQIGSEVFHEECYPNWYLT